MSNRLQYETSPYLLQHKDNPVDWYPWCEEAFERARKEDRPIFLSIGYSACHWCHVLAHESFEDQEIAELLNRYYISIKVDKEERPDIDSVYMTVCQAFTGSGGWPMSIFMTCEQRPFFAGTYFPKTTQGGRIGLKELLWKIHKIWEQDREALMQQSEQVINHLKRSDETKGDVTLALAHLAVEGYRRIYDSQYGGFGQAPKFPTPHNLLFLLSYYRRYKEEDCLEMAEHTLRQMYRGGLFDHIGFGFCCYSTDRSFLVPHFEKMLYDNALLILAYCTAYAVNKERLYLHIAEKTATYILREMTSQEGGFYSAQDADSEGEEGKYYLFTPDEIIHVLGEEDGEKFNRQYGIQKQGNFEGKNIPNLLESDPMDDTLASCLPKLYHYRKKRCTLHLDDKILTSWNSLMIAAMCELYLVSQKEHYLQAAIQADLFIQTKLLEEDTLYVSYREGKRGVAGFLDDYACYIFAQLALYRATLEQAYLTQADKLCQKVIRDFSDPVGGFYLYSDNSEELILRPKETYDGAIPSGNSMMAYNLVRLSELFDQKDYANAAEELLHVLAADVSQYPLGYGMYLTALLEYLDPPAKVTVVSDGQMDRRELSPLLPVDTVVIYLSQPTKTYPLKDGKTTYYVCCNHSCLPPVHDLSELSVPLL